MPDTNKIAQAALSLLRLLPPKVGKEVVAVIAVLVAVGQVIDWTLLPLSGGVRVVIAVVLAVAGIVAARGNVAQLVVPTPPQ
jgi:hypothetical protein